MTREELKRHCEKQVEGCEMWAKHIGKEPHGELYEEHKLILELLEQEPKTGHWIWRVSSHECSFCQQYTCFSYKNPPRFCPNCGAKMDDPQESEGEE